MLSCLSNELINSKENHIDISFLGTIHVNQDSIPFEDARKEEGK